MRPELVLIASANGGVFSRAQALACGYSQRETRMLVETGLWTVLRHGVYIDSVHMLDADPSDRAVLAIAAARLCVSQPSVGSHTSAGRAYGLPRMDSDVATHLSAAQRQRRGTKKAPIVVHRAALPDTHVRTLNGVSVTTPGRTVIDLATMLPFADAVAAADAALHNNLTTPPELAFLLNALGDPVLAASVVSAADGASESPLESISRVVIIAHGIERPRRLPLAGPPGDRRGRRSCQILHRRVRSAPRKASAGSAREGRLPRGPVDLRGDHGQP